MPWLATNGFSSDWQATFIELRLGSQEFLDLAKIGETYQSEHGVLYAVVYPQLARMCVRSGIGWGEQRERPEGRRLRWLIQQLVNDGEGEPVAQSEYTRGARVAHTLLYLGADMMAKGFDGDKMFHYMASAGDSAMLGCLDFFHDLKFDHETIHRALIVKNMAGFTPCDLALARPEPFKDIPSLYSYTVFGKNNLHWGDEP